MDTEVYNSRNGGVVLLGMLDESTLISSSSRLAEHLYAEIVSGTVSIAEGARWLGYTYLSVRIPKIL